MSVPAFEMSPKEALIKDGKVETKLGKGRMREEQIIRVKELVALGWKIKGYVSSTPRSTTKATKPNEVVRVKPANNNDVVEMRPYRYDEDKFYAQAADGTIFGMREACQPCGYSLVGHICDDPIVLGYRVTIKEKK